MSHLKILKKQKLESGKSRQTVTEGEAVDEREAVKPVVVLRVAHREESRAIPQEGALQPRWDGACRAKVASLTLGWFAR